MEILERRRVVDVRLRGEAAHWGHPHLGRVDRGLVELGRRVQVGSWSKKRISGAEGGEGAPDVRRTGYRAVGPLSSPAWCRRGTRAEAG